MAIHKNDDKKEEVKKEEKKEVKDRDPVEVKKTIILGQIRTILASYNGLESNIDTPHHEYWALVNLYRGLGK